MAVEKERDSIGTVCEGEATACEGEASGCDMYWLWSGGYPLGGPMEARKLECGAGCRRAGPGGFIRKVKGKQWEGN